MGTVDLKTAYLYIRVSTDEQKRKGYSLPEQEDRLLKYCQFNNISVKGIYREDFSAKDFNRPQWKKLISTIRKNKSEISSNILFVKWDRFSRNIEYAYEMIGILRSLNVSALAIDQPIDFDIPESSVMLAVYLAIPDAENGRRALNTSNGIYRAKLLGRYPGKAPLGYINLTSVDGKKYIAPKFPEANIIKWAFGQLAKSSFAIEEVRRMACIKGLKCSRSNFWKLIRNPAYCGIIAVPPRNNEEQQLIKANHKPLISEELFQTVQSIINTKRRIKGKTDELKTIFILRGYLNCPACGRKLTGSFSKGATKKYAYYHCIGKCGVRFRADLLNTTYEELLKQICLASRTIDLFKLVLENVNATTEKAKYLNQQRSLIDQIEEHEQVISKARRLLISGKIEIDDFYFFKGEYQNNSMILKDELEKVNLELSLIETSEKGTDWSLEHIFYRFKDFSLNDKKYIINLLSPVNINAHGIVCLQSNIALSKILAIPNGIVQINNIRLSSLNKPLYPLTTNFVDRNIPIKSVVEILSKRDINVTTEEAGSILDFLYILAKGVCI